MVSVTGGNEQKIITERVLGTRVQSGMAHRAPRSTVGTPIAADHHDENRFSIGGCV